MQATGDDYLREQQIPEILKSLVTQLCVEKPDRPVKFMIDHLRQWYLPAETERYHTENYYGYKNTTPITWGIHANIRNDAPHLQELNDASLIDDEEGVGGKRGRGVMFDEMDDEDDGKRPRRNAFCDAPSAFGAQLDLEKFPEKPAHVVEVLERAARSNPLFKKLERDDRLLLYRAMFPVHYKADDVIIREGDQGDNFYIVSEGECVVYVKNNFSQPVLRYKAGDSFGELALIHGTPRQATVVAVTNVTVWGLERTAYRASLMRMTMDKRERYGAFLQGVPLLSSLDRYDRLVISDCLEPIDYADGDIILRQGDIGNSFFLIVSGRVRVVQKAGDREGEVGMLGPGQYFGEIALLTDSTRQATCIAEGPVKCVYMQREDFERVMGPVRDLVKSQIPMYKRYLDILEAKEKESDTKEEK